MDDDHHHVKQEPHENPYFKTTPTNHIHVTSKPPTFIDLGSSSDDRNSNSEHDLNDFIDSILNGKGKSAVDCDDVLGNGSKRQMFELPVGFLDPLPPAPMDPAALVMPPPPLNLQDELAGNAGAGHNSKQFWKAGDYVEAQCGDWETKSVGMDHVRVHPKFLHSNATSHKWALGAFAELLDNALDEIYSGATYANIDMLQSNKDNSRMLLIEDNGGGMDPDKMRQCMSLGYSVKSKIANTIGQYGNGFKTSTMRLGADVIVFSRCGGRDGKGPTQSIGLLSYTFLRSTGKEDIVVPMLDYEKGAGEWNKIIRSTIGDWIKNVETIVHWSPFSNEAELLRQFNLVKEHGTRIIIYNLWEDDQGLLELDFDTDKYDILLRGVNRDEKNIQMANQFPNSRHFWTYMYSLRSYASILYRRIAPGFRIILRGKDVEHHNIVNDMMISQEVMYRPQTSSNGITKNSNMLAIVTVGFVKDAVHHIDVQGFNVYHKNRLIKPFWRIWNSTGSDGRGVIGVLEANFVEPAHDKQGFERTNVLSRLETRLIQMQKTYWYTYCHKIGYSQRINRRSLSKETSSKGNPSSSKVPISDSDTFHTSKDLYGKFNKGKVSSKKKNEPKSNTKAGKRSSLSDPSSSSDDERGTNGGNQKKVKLKKCYEKNNSTILTSFGPENNDAPQECGSAEMHIQPHKSLQSKGGDSDGNELNASNFNSRTIDQLREANRELMESLKKSDNDISKNLLLDIHQVRERCKLVENQLQETQQKIKNVSREQGSFIQSFAEERDRRDTEEENLRKKLKEATNTIQELLKSSNSRSGYENH